ncbi:MAG: aminopeptidase P family protein, partial [Candidatus Omnitrophica bacterium]|nr:aminopeptidase P family protein [Candidatus Omnitrophota bacterium]
MKQRVNICSRLLSRDKFSGLLISNPVNISYLTGSEPMDGYLLVTSSAELFFFTNSIYALQAKKIPSWRCFTASLNKNILQLICEKIKSLKLRRVGFETKHLPYLQQKTLNRFLLDKKVFFVETNDFIEKMRMIKAEPEINCIRKAITVNLQAFEYACQIFNPKTTEKNLAIEIEKFLSLNGDKDLAFPVIVAGGKNSVYPHYQPKQTAIGHKNFLIDLGSKHSGYCADLTRV